MSFSELETKEHEKLVGEFITKRRPPAHIRDKVDINFRLSGQSIEIFEIRAVWDNPEQKSEEPVAKATYVKRQKLWKVHYMRSNMKWHKYEPEFEVVDLARFIAIVDEDKYNCFWG